MVMSAMLSTAGGWERCSRDWARIQRTFGFTVFHATEFRALRGEFEGWSAEKCFDLYMEFGQLGATHLTECFTISLPYETYKTHFLDRRPQKMHRTSQYGICFMGVLDGLMRTVISHGPQSKLSVVVEDGHKNAKDTARLFDDRKRRLDTAGIDLLRSHALEKKERSPLLQFADITAHAHTQDKRAIKSGTAPDFSTRNERGPAPGQPGWSVYEVTPDYIARIIDEYNSDRVAKREYYLKRRGTWLDGKAASGAP
jgi:Protein of unknown function (DUF3800)